MLCLLSLSLMLFQKSAGDGKLLAEISEWTQEKASQNMGKLQCRLSIHSSAQRLLHPAGGFMGDIRVRLKVSVAQTSLGWLLPSVRGSTLG